VIDVVEILQHWYAGRPKREVARSLGVHRETVLKYVRPAEREGIVPGGPLVSPAEWQQRARRWFPHLYDSSVARPSYPLISIYHEEIKRLLDAGVPMAVIHQRLSDDSGLTSSVASLRRYVRLYLPAQVHRDEVVIWRPDVEAGAEAQVDYCYLGMWDDPVSGRRRRVWGFSMVMSYSRHLFLYPVLKMDQAAWNDVHIAAFSFFSGCPARIVLDNLRAGVLSPDLYDPKINRAYSELASYYQVLVDPARVAHPKDKPRIEAVQGYARNSFFAGRQFSSIEQMVEAARSWSAEVAGRRAPRALEGRTPSEVFAADEAGALIALPKLPFELVTWSRPRVGPDAHCRVGKVLYSVPYRLIGQYLDARITSTTVQFHLDGELQKTHPKGEKGRRTDWGDLPEERVGFFMRTPIWCQDRAALVGKACGALVADLLSVNAIYLLRQAQGVIRLGDKYGSERLEAACRMAIMVGDPTYQTVKGILVAGTENDAIPTRLGGMDLAGFLHGPEAFGDEQ
jgi:transposase